MISNFIGEDSLLFPSHHPYVRKNNYGRLDVPDHKKFLEAKTQSPKMIRLT